MDARYVQRGDAIDFRPDRDIAAGEVVVLGKLVGVAKLDIKAGELGSLAFEGVFDMAKLTNYGMIGCGIAGWDVNQKAICSRYATGAIPVGHNIKSMVISSEPRILVRLCQGLNRS